MKGRLEDPGGREGADASTVDNGAGKANRSLLSMEVYRVTAGLPVPVTIAARSGDGVLVPADTLAPPSDDSSSL